MPEKITPEIFFDAVLQGLKKNFPFDISGWIDLYKKDTIAIGVTTTLIDFTVPRCNFGVFKQFGFGYIQGNIDNISFEMRLNNVLVPQVYNTTYQADIAYPIYLLDAIHLDIKSNDNIKIKVTNASTVTGDTSTVWVRLKGWYY